VDETGSVDGPDQLALHVAHVIQSGTGFGLHLDIEPDLTGRPVVDRFVAVVRAVAESVPSDIPLEADVRFWSRDVSAGERDAGVNRRRGDRAQLSQPNVRT